MTRARLLLVLVAAVAPVSVGAQTVLLSQEQTESVAVEFWHPAFDDDGDPGWPSGSLYMTVRKDAKTWLAVVGIPVAIVKHPASTRITNGNMYLGMETRAPARGKFFEAGLIVPLVTSGVEGGEIGYYADDERFEEFLQTLTVTAAVNYRWTDAKGLGVRVRLSPDLFLPYFGQAEVLADYGGFVFYEGPRARMLGGVSGHTWLSGNVTAPGDRTMVDLQVAVAARLGNVSPGLVFRYPVNDAFLNAGVSSVLGLTLEVALSPSTR